VQNPSLEFNVFLSVVNKLADFMRCKNIKNKTFQDFLIKSIARYGDLVCQTEVRCPVTAEACIFFEETSSRFHGLKKKVPNECQSARWMSDFRFLINIIKNLTSLFVVFMQRLTDKHP
jgi:hypothetical protein